MKTNDKTLADVQPGGRVRLGDQAERARFEAWAEERELGTAKCSADGMKGDYADLNTDWCWAAWRAALSAQPSPGGQDALRVIAERLRGAGASLPAPPITGTIEGSMVTGLSIALALVEEALAARQPVYEGHTWVSDYVLAGLRERAALPLQIRNGEVWHWQGDGHDFPESLVCPVIMSAETLRALLAARQPSKQPDSVALGEATEFCVEKGDRKPVHGSGTLVDSGALQMALNVLRRAGKDEVAHALEATAARQPVSQYEVQTENGPLKCSLAVYSEWQKNEEYIKRLESDLEVARQPVGEQRAALWIQFAENGNIRFWTKDQDLALAESFLHARPLTAFYASPQLPAQAVDLGQFRAKVAELLRREFDLEVSDPEDHRYDEGSDEADRIAGRIVALIDSHSAGGQP